MSDIEVSRVITASPETLYDIVSDLPRMGDLSPENTGGVWLDNVSGATVGARFRGTNSNGKKHWATEAVIEEAERGKVFCFKVGVGPIKISRWRYTFEPVDGGTKVTETWEDRRGPAGRTSRAFSTTAWSRCATSSTSGRSSTPASCRTSRR